MIQPPAEPTQETEPRAKPTSMEEIAPEPSPASVEEIQSTATYEPVALAEQDQSSGQKNPEISALHLP